MTVTNIGVQRPSTALRRSDGLSAIASLRHHWPEYLMEVGELGLYLFVACVDGLVVRRTSDICSLFALSRIRYITTWLTSGQKMRGIVRPS